LLPTVPATAITPEQHVPPTPDMLVDELAFLRMVEHGVEQRLAFRWRHVDDADGHQAVDVDRLAAGVLVGAKHRMGAFGEGHGAAVVALLGRSIVSEGHGLTAFSPFADRRASAVD